MAVKTSIGSDDSLPSVWAIAAFVADAQVLKQRVSSDHIDFKTSRMANEYARDLVEW